MFQVSFYDIFMLFVLFLCFKVQIKLNEMVWKTKNEKRFYWNSAHDVNISVTLKIEAK